MPTLTFQDPSGTPLAGGYVTFQLQFDISTGSAAGPQIAAGRMTQATLDTNGSCTVTLAPNATYLPTGSVYFVKAYTAAGQPAWSGEITVAAPSYLLLENGGRILLENGGGILLEQQ